MSRQRARSRGRPSSNNRVVASPPLIPNTNDRVCRALLGRIARLAAGAGARLGSALTRHTVFAVLDLTTAAIVFGLIFLIELPDKTFIATLVMSTRFRPLLVWIGVTAAFFVQTLVSVLIGGVLTKLPKTPIEIFATLMFLIGGFLLLRGAGKADEEEAETEEEFDAKTAKGRDLRGWHVVSLCFGILFLAEWGDLSQILTASLVLKYQDPVSVFVGAFLALATVSGLAAVLGRVLLRKMRLSTLRRIGGVVCLLLAALSIAQILGLIAA